MSRAGVVVGVGAVLAIACARASAPDAAEDIVFSSYLGGAAEDSVRDVAIDAQGNVVLVGGTASPDFPATPGAADTTFGGNHDVFVAKLDGSGRLLWATFLGGPSYDRAYAVELDAEGNVVVAGRAGDGYPTTPGVVQERFGGDVTPNVLYGPQDGFVTKLSADGRRVLWSTFLGGDDDSIIRDVALDASGRPVVGMGALRPLPHITPGAFQTTHAGGGRDGFLALLSFDAKRVEWATYFGGSGDESGQPSVRARADGIYAVWSSTSADLPVTPGAAQSTAHGKADVVLVKFSLDGSRLLYATYLGGSGNDGFETHNLEVDRDGAAIIAGSTTSPDLPSTEGAAQRSYGGGDGEWGGDAFVARVAPDGSRIEALTYLGGSAMDALEGVSIAADGSIVVSGMTASADFPLVAGAMQATHGGDADFFVARFAPDLRQVTGSTLFGGSALDVGRASALHPSGDVVVGGMTYSSDLPLRAAAQAQLGGGRDGAIVRLRMRPRADGAASASGTPLR